MAIHKPSSIWLTKKVGQYPQLQLKTVDKNALEITCFPAKRMAGFAFKVTRHDAKMLAKRINQCLDATK